MIKSELRQLIRNNLNDSDGATDDNFSDAKIDSFLFEAVSHVQIELMDLDLGYFEAEQTGTQASDATELALPANCLRVIDFRRVDNNYNTQFVFIDKRQADDYLTREINNYHVYLQGDKIKYVVPLNQSHDYRLVYIAEIEDVAASADYGLPKPVEQLAVLYATLQCITSEEGETGKWEKQYADKLNLISKLKQRQTTQPRYVQYIP